VEAVEVVLQLVEEEARQMAVEVLAVRLLQLWHVDPIWLGGRRLEEQVPVPQALGLLEGRQDFLQL
jgi:hypothetical protein